MRVLSTLISSFIFASAILEFHTLLARAQKVFIQGWAGAEIFAPEFLGVDPFDLMVAVFNVPEVLYEEGDPNTAAFIGMTFGSAACNINAISVGVFVNATSDGTIRYNVACQVHPFQMTIGELSVDAGDQITTYILALDGIPSIVTVWSASKARSWNPRPPRSLKLRKWKLCNRIVQWQIGTIRTEDEELRYLELPRFDQMPQFQSSYAAKFLDGSDNFPVGGHDSTLQSVRDGALGEVWPIVYPGHEYNLGFVRVS